MDFAKELKRHQSRLKISQERLAEILGVSPRTVWKWLQGEEPLKLTQEGALARLDKRLGIFEANTQKHRPEGSGV
jgi:transcriptional regulator with XRE-family HTH domain